jgi:glycosyltransferase involved in cell wall biosynthesis
MAESINSKIVCLSNVFDQHYLELRGEKIAPCLSSPKRRDLFRCLELATGREVVVLSSPPKAMERRSPKWLPAIATHFSTHRQFFCANWDAPKVRIPLGWFFYMAQAVRRIRSGDLVLIDNYEFIYVVAGYAVRLFRRVDFILEYEDGKHAIDKSWGGVLSGLAEKMGRRLIRAAILAHPALGRRLPPDIPTMLSPGFVVRTNPSPDRQSVTGEVQLLYSGSLDRPRGVDLLLAALPLLPETGWHLHITGAGPLEKEAAALAAEPRWQERVTFHGTLAAADYTALVGRCHVGLNCQRPSDPISAVTFPSKIFSYQSAGLLVLSSRASDVTAVCGDACIYYEAETPAALAEAICRAVQHYPELSRPEEAGKLAALYGIEGTAQRIIQLLAKANIA